MVSRSQSMIPAHEGREKMGAGDLRSLLRVALRRWPMNRIPPRRGICAAATHGTADGRQAGGEHDAQRARPIPPNRCFLLPTLERPAPTSSAGFAVRGRPRSISSPPGASLAGRKWRALRELQSRLSRAGAFAIVPISVAEGRRSGYARFFAGRIIAVLQSCLDRDRAVCKGVEYSHAAFQPSCFDGRA